MKDVLLTLLMAFILWPILSWTRILLLMQTGKFYVFLLINLLLGLIFGYLSSIFVQNPGWSTWLAIIAIISAYRSRNLYKPWKLILSTLVFVVSFYSFFVEFVGS
jgi:hypothetical protein